MTDEPTPPEADETDEELDDDEPEVSGFMEMPKIGGMGQILPPIKVPPTGPAGPGPAPGGSDTIGGPRPGGGTPGPVTFPGPA